MKRILVLATGGTIASVPGENGLEPLNASPHMLRVMEDLGAYYDITFRDILNLDSSNIQGEEWRLIATEVFAALNDYDGIVITHGTDTMAYTASMLSFMLQNLKKPVVLTGSQVPIHLPLSDARSNLATAFSAIDRGITGVNIAFNYKIINGCRAVKVRTMGYNAFESVNAPVRSELLADGSHFESLHPPIKEDEPTLLKPDFCNDVFLLKLIPGTNPRIFDSLLDMNYKGVVLEAFGAGGLHFIRRDLSEKIEQLVSSGIAVVVCSQCLYERSDFSIYEVGRKILSTGVLEGRDMTTESAVTKLMWSLGQTSDMQEVRKMFATNYAGEISL